MPEEARLTEIKQQQFEIGQPHTSGLKRLPWHAPVFSTLDVKATNGRGGGGGGGNHCWNSWKCS